MNVKNRMQKIRLETQNLTESVERNLNGSVKGRRYVAKEDTVGSIEHEVKTLRRDLMLLLDELRNPEARK